MSQVWATAPFEKTTLLVLLALADSAHDDGKCWPAISTIAHKARCGERWCRRVIDELEAEGWIERIQRPGMSSMYRVIIKATPGLEASPAENTGLVQGPGEDWPTGQGSPGLQARENRKRTVREPSASTSKVSFPADLEVTPEMRAVVSSKPGLDGATVFASYRRYWMDRPRTKRTVKSWQGASWAEWVSREKAPAALPAWQVAQQAQIERERQRFAPPAALKEDPLIQSWKEG